MRYLYIFTLFDPASGRPRCTGIRAGSKTIIKDLYRPGAGKTYRAIADARKEIKKIILETNKNNKPIVISDFKSHIKQFELPLLHSQYDVYDVHLPDIKPSKNQAKDNVIVRSVLDKMQKVNVKEYHKILANASVVYQSMENNGVLHGFVHAYPKWSLKTYSGRSKTTGFNIQGTTNNDHITAVGASENSVFIHFDWVCADIRVASLLSNDPELISSFELSDPYAYMRDKITHAGEISRDECKLMLLKAINSMNFRSVALSGVYCVLGEWIANCRDRIKKGGGSLETILGRKFKRKYAKNELAVLNGAMQGSVVHAMQLAIRKIWEILDDKLIAEVHDSLVIVVENDPKKIRHVIDTVVPIMLNPFDGVLEQNPKFPLSISIGKKWKKWKLLGKHT